MRALSPSVLRSRLYAGFRTELLSFPPAQPVGLPGGLTSFPPSTPAGIPGPSASIRPRGWITEPPPSTTAGGPVREDEIHIPRRPAICGRRRAAAAPDGSNSLPPGAAGRAACASVAWRCVRWISLSPPPASEPESASKSEPPAPASKSGLRGVKSRAVDLQAAAALRHVFWTLRPAFRSCIRRIHGSIARIRDSFECYQSRTDLASSPAEPLCMNVRRFIQSGIQGIIGVPSFRLIRQLCRRDRFECMAAGEEAAFRAAPRHIVSAFAHWMKQVSFNFYILQIFNALQRSYRPFLAIIPILMSSGEIAENCRQFDQKNRPAGRCRRGSVFYEYAVSGYFRLSTRANQSSAVLMSAFDQHEPNQ